MAKQASGQRPAMLEGPLATRPNRDERYAAGKAIRARVPREQHGKWKAPRNRPNSVGLLVASSEGRVPELLPIRYGRMSVSPFTFYRGTALNMAADLASTPNTGIRLQVCGDCHLMNFGGYATPERRQVFDINDFDETLPGPWEWDVKRLAASFALASRSNGFPAADQRDAATACARSYRKWIGKYADMRGLDVWYARIEMDAVLESTSDAAAAIRLRKRLARTAAKSVPESTFPKLVEGSGGQFVIRDDPPLVYHDRLINLASDRANILDSFAAYRATLPDDRRVLLDRYRMVDFAVKVVGVGSVGTFCGVVLLMADDDDPLFLQVKEARSSVLEPYLGKSDYSNEGQRVVVGQRLMQSASDIFLGWTGGRRGRQFYYRQLRDMKFKFLVESFSKLSMLDYAALCGRTLARAHARSGDAAMVAGYLGKRDVFDRAIGDFALAYADQAERDHGSFMKAIRRGRIKVQMEPCP
jgi:uncharacterized protein (DUF2252 family)